MATATKIIRVANPRRGRFRLRTARRKRNNSRHRRMTAKQIKYFGSARQRAALKGARKRKRTRTSAGGRKRRRNTGVKVVYVTKRTNPRKRARRRRTANPGLIVTLGSVNPKRRTHKVARTRKRRRARRVNSRRRITRTRTRARVRTRRRRRNPVRAYAVAPRRANRRRRRHVNRRRIHRRHRRNPAIFGRSGGKDLLKMGAGILVGVTVTKMIPRYIPASITSSIGSGGVMAVVVSAVSAWIAGFALSKVDPEFGQAAMLGGFAQTISVGLNAFLPSVGGYLSLGDLVNGNFVVPQNPIRAGMAPMVSAPAARGMSAYPSAY